MCAHRNVGGQLGQAYADLGLLFRKRHAKSQLHLDDCSRIGELQEERRAQPFRHACATLQVTGYGMLAEMKAQNTEKVRRSTVWRAGQSQRM